MIKVKSFTDYSANELERKINNWLKENKKIEIIEVSQSQSPPENEIVIFIFYKEKNEE
ncbi:MAG: hypothetical protein ACK413_02560 [Patescibacteria group bacterium]